MLGIVVLSVLIGGALMALFATRKGTRSTPRQDSEKHTMLYAPGPIDEAGQVYHSARKDGAMPFPLSKKKERKRTETYRRHSDD